MGAGYRLTPTAMADLEQTVEYVLERFGPEVAEQVYLSFEQAFALLSSSPGLGRRRPELTDKPVRFWPVGPALVVYRGEPGAVEIIHIGRSRDWPQVLQ